MKTRTIVILLIIAIALAALLYCDAKVTPCGQTGTLYANGRCVEVTETP